MPHELLQNVWSDTIRPAVGKTTAKVVGCGRRLLRHLDAGAQPSRVTSLSQIRLFESAGTQSIPTEMGQLPCQCEPQNESAQRFSPSPSLGGWPAAEVYCMKRLSDQKFKNRHHDYSLHTTGKYCPTACRCPSSSRWVFVHCILCRPERRACP